MTFQLEIINSGRNEELLISFEHISMKAFFIHFYVKGFPTIFQRNQGVHLAVVLAQFPEEMWHQCQSVSVLPIFLNNYTSRFSVLHSETGYGKECPSVSSFSCSKVIFCESYKKWVDYNTKQTNIREKPGLFNFVSGLSWYLYTSAFQIVKSYERDCSSCNNRASNMWLPQNQLL